MSDSIRAIVTELSTTYRNIKACIPSLVASKTTIPLSGTAKVDYQNCDCLKTLEELCDRLNRLLDIKISGLAVTSLCPVITSRDIYKFGAAVLQFTT